MIHNSSGHYLDLDTWPGRRMFDFFSQYQHPFFNLCAEVEATASVKACRDLGIAPTWVGWYHCQQVVNALEPFRYRLRQGRIWAYDQVSIASTVLADDGSFRFCYLPYQRSFPKFDAAARLVAADPIAGTKNAMGDQPGNDAVVHGSVIPWVRFSSISHAQKMDPSESIPRVVFGRFSNVGDRVMVPVSVEVHHALVDGQTVGRFFQALESAFADSASLQG